MDKRPQYLDVLHLWYLGNPASPHYVGVLNQLSECEAFGLSKEEAAKELMGVIEAVNTARPFCAGGSVSGRH